MGVSARELALNESFIGRGPALCRAGRRLRANERTASGRGPSGGQATGGDAAGWKPHVLSGRPVD